MNLTVDDSEMRYRITSRGLQIWRTKNPPKKIGCYRGVPLSKFSKEDLETIIYRHLLVDLEEQARRYTR